MSAWWPFARRDHEIRIAEYYRVPTTEYRPEGGRNPESLFRLCIKYLAHNLDVLTVKSYDGYFILREGLTLPRMICEPLFETYQSSVGEITDDFAFMFRDVSRTNLKSVDIRYSCISDRGLNYLLQHNLHKLTIVNCGQLTSRTYLNIMKHARNLQSLEIGPNISITPFDKSSLTLEDIPKRICKRAPNLNHLALRVKDSNSKDENMYLKSMLYKISNLCVLDLSYSYGIGNLGYLGNLNHLHTLLLFDVPNLPEGKTISNICSLRSLV